MSETSATSSQHSRRVKYLRHVEDTYFNEASLDPLVKALFAFASYNAAQPHPIAAEGTAKRGSTPTAGSRAGVRGGGEDRAGDVTYVSNIFKYYIAYQLLARAEQERKDAREQMETEALADLHQVLHAVSSLVRRLQSFSCNVVGVC